MSFNILGEMQHDRQLIRDLREMLGCEPEEIVVRLVQLQDDISRMQDELNRGGYWQYSVGSHGITIMTWKINPLEGEV